MHTDERPDLVDERRSWLLERLAQRRRVATNEAADLLEVSVDTVRRDLRALHDRGLLRRVHGGAVPLSPLAPSFSGRTADDSPRRAALADAVVRTFRSGQLIGLDAGTTTTRIAACLPTSLEVTIVTNNPAAALALADHPAARVILVGGQVDLTWMATTGPAAVDAIREYHLDLAVVGVCAFDADHGAATRSRDEVATKRAFMAAAAETVMPLESSKLGTVAPFRICGTDAVDRVVIEAGADPERVAACEAAGTAVEVV